MADFDNSFFSDKTENDLMVIIKNSYRAYRKETVDAARKELMRRWEEKKTTNKK